MIKEILRRVLGYFGKPQDRKHGPTVLGMETQYHHDVPADAEEIRKAVKEAKEQLNKKKE